MHEGYAQDIAPQLSERFDGILFDAYPNNKDEAQTFHLDFFPIARRLLRPDGVFSYFAGQPTEFSHLHLNALFTHFNVIKLYRVDGLEPPEECEYWHRDYMILASARVEGD